MKRPKGRVGFVRISVWRSSGVGSKAFRMTEKQSGDDFSYFTSLFPCSQAGSWMDITLSSTALSRDLRYLQPLEDNWKVLRIKGALCAATVLFTLVWLTHHCFWFCSISPLHLMWQTGSASLSPGEKNLAIMTIQFFFSNVATIAEGWNDWQKERVWSWSRMAKCPRNFSFRAAKGECFL